jgi:serine/threonine protein kinase
MNERTVFITALEKEDSAQRKAYLDDVCAGDRALRERIEALLRSHEREGRFLDVPAVEQLAPGGVTREEIPAAADEGDALEFLTPSEEPGSLGRLGHYDVQEVVGRGGMGIVLKALDQKLHRVVAIKVMAAQLATSATARQRFAREAQAAAAVSHDNVVTIHAVEAADSLPYLVMQYVSGLSLQQRLDRDGPLDLPEILRIGMQTASGLAAAHAQGLIHRDIKPANILLENSVERVKITDFGLARAAADASLTQSGIVAGTPQYMSPEQARGEPVDRRTDLFSLGSVLYAICTGRPPFRATTGMAVLKRVCDETPTPIRDSNSEIPDWLVAIIDKLHAKDPAQRYQSAAEVAELLGRHLAHVQHPSLAPLPTPFPRPSPRWWTGARRRGRPWAIAAAVILFMVAGLGLTEATGVTNLRATVIRIITGDGTLIVEVNDSEVKVTIEGDGGIVIIGAGPHEVRLRPGSYKLQAAKDGKPVHLDQELVTIARGDKQVVRVSLERDAAAKMEPGAFVVLGCKAVAERKFDTLTEAVVASSDGDTLEIRGNGPFITEPINLQKQALTIRAASGFHPIIRLSSAGAQAPLYLFRTEAPLVLEGLELQMIGQKPTAKGKGQPSIVDASGKSLYAANCRFRVEETVCILVETPVCVARNCEFLCPTGFSVAGWFPKDPWKSLFPQGARRILDNCLQVGRISQSILFFGPAENALEIRITRNTVVSSVQPIHLFLKAAPSERDSAEPIRVDASGNVFDAVSVLQITQLQSFLDKHRFLHPPEAAATLRRIAAWRDGENLYAVGGSSVHWNDANVHRNDTELGQGPKGLDDWKRFWGEPNAKSMEGRLRYHGGNLLYKVVADPDKLTPDDFRLRPDSAGYRAGKDAKDLGADVDLVGPGKAYERWKKTPDYQQWLKDTGQKK